MTRPGGGFYSAEDADSLPPEHAADPKRTSRRRLLRLDATRRSARCSARTPAVARQRFGIEPGGNAPQDPQGEFTGKNLLYTARSRRRGRGADTGATPTTSSPRSARARADAVRRARAARPRPHLDDKVLTAWNGMMIAAFARAARVLPAGRRPGVSEAAARGAARSSATSCGATGRHLLRRYRDGDAAIDAYAEDYACLDLGTARAVPGRRRSRLARVGARRSRRSRTRGSGTRRTAAGSAPRARPVGPSAAEGRLRRRRAVGELGGGAERAHAGASDRRRHRSRQPNAPLLDTGPGSARAARTIPMMLCALSA